jgi:cold shock CspA family protein
MRIPLEISFHGISRSESIEKIIHNDVTKLERVCDRLISCRVGIKLDQKSNVTANQFRVKIEMRVPPGHNLVVTNTSGTKEAADDLPTVVRNTFKSAHRRLKQLTEKQQGAKKSHPEQEVSGIITKIFSEEGYGFLRTLEGDEIYFHQNSIVNDEFDRLQPGTGVSYTAELGEEGLQASSVQVLDKTPEHSREEKPADDVASPLGWQRQKK